MSWYTKLYLTLNG